MKIEDEIAELRAENAELRRENAELRRQVQELMEALQESEEALSGARQRVEELGKKKKETPSWVKANKPASEGEKAPRRKRAAEHNRARRRKEPTRIIRHELERCPTCGYKLHGSRVGHRHQVEEIPPPAPVEITEHQVIKRYCPHCDEWHAPKLDLREEVLGQGRIGVHAASLIVYLRHVMRLPYRQIRVYLKERHQMSLSVGGIVGILHRAGAASKPEIQALYAAARSSPVLNVDETGWRENGQNGYIWALCVPGPEPIRLFHYNQSRSRHVVQGLLGLVSNGFQGVLCSDFLGSYNIYDGPHQRCWVHLLRDLHELKEKHPEHITVRAWAKAVRNLYDEAQGFVLATSPPSQRDRVIRYHSLLARLQRLGQAHARSDDHPCRTLAKRLLRHQDEMFQFVLHPEVSADNNFAERSLRPQVIARKISGGTRSDAGTTTRMTLASLVSTWAARGLNPYEECLSLLRKTPVPQV
jgi:transposase